MKYAKFENEKLIYAPRVLKLTDGYEIVNPTKEQYLQAGYKEIIYTEQPEQEEGFYFTSKIVNRNDIPTQEWERHEIVEELKELEK